MNRHTQIQCKGTHCKCMRPDCPNYHYADHVAAMPKMIEPMWLKTTVYVNGLPKEVEPSAIDVAVKLNEVIEVLNTVINKT